MDGSASKRLLIGLSLERALLSKGNRIVKALIFCSLVHIYQPHRMRNKLSLFVLYCVARRGKIAYLQERSINNIDFR